MIDSPYQFRRLTDGTWQRRQRNGPWLTLNVAFIGDRSNKNRPKQAKWNWT